MLHIEKLSKKFAGNDFYSLKDVSLDIKKGEIVGLIGKNGAGKSTLMKLIAKSLKPTSGKIIYDDVDINTADNLLKDFGIMIDPVFYPEMSVMDNLKFYLTLHQKTEYFSNIEPTLKLLALWDARHRKPKGFSFGMKQRTALAIAMVAEPDFLILDEPFVGLDPLGVQSLIAILKQWSSERRISMLISSHQLSELQALCERYIYLDNGQLADSFEGADVSSVLIDLTNHEIDLSVYLGDHIQYDGQKIAISTQAKTAELNAIFNYLASQSLIKSLTIKENHLQDIFSKGE